MLTIFYGGSLLLFAMVALLSEWQFALLLAMVSGVVYFAILLSRLLRGLPKFNPVEMIAVSTGAFYFTGGMLAVGSSVLIGDNPYAHIFARWRNYEVGPMAAAAVLAFLCSLVAIYASKLFNFRNLGSFVNPRTFYGSIGPVSRDRVVGAWLVVGAAVFSAWLLLAGILTPKGATDLYDLQKAAGREYVVIAVTLIPASLLLLNYFLLSRDSGFTTKVIMLLAAAPIGVATLTLGRRYIIAAVVIFAVSLSVHRGVRLKPRTWFAWGIAAVIIFFAISGPFLIFREAQQYNHALTFDQFVVAATSGDVYGIRRMSLPDLLALSAARTDLMGELAQMTSRTPLSVLHWGTGLLSESSMLVPSFFWPGKARFLAYQMYNDYRICIDAGLTPTDLAGTLVLYSFGEVGWLAPVWYTGIAIAFVAMFDAIVGFFRSFTLYLMAMSLLLVFALVADNDWGGEMLGEIRFLVGAGIIIAFAKMFVAAPSKGQAQLLEPSISATNPSAVRSF